MYLTHQLIQKQVKLIYMKVLIHTELALFTVCWNSIVNSRYAPSKFGQSRQNTRYPYIILIKNLCSKWALKRKFLPHFSHSDRFICVFSCNPMSYTRKQWKMPGKIPRCRFITRFMSKIWSKSRKIPYFH